jgi:hypothetical protein
MSNYNKVLCKIFYFCQKFCKKPSNFVAAYVFIFN